MARNTFEIEGMKELEAAIKELGSLPQKCVTGAAKDGAKIALSAAKALAPIDDGDLKAGIVMKGERKSKAGKKVYDIGMDPKKNDLFVRTTKEGKRYYYPASMEFGFLKANGEKVPGVHFLRDALINNAAQIEAKVIEKLTQLIDKAWKKGR